RSASSGGGALRCWQGFSSGCGARQKGAGGQGGARGTSYRRYPLAPFNEAFCLCATYEGCLREPISLELCHGQEARRENTWRRHALRASVVLVVDSRIVRVWDCLDICHRGASDSDRLVNLVAE